MVDENIAASDGSALKSDWEMFRRVKKIIKPHTDLYYWVGIQIESLRSRMQHAEKMAKRHNVRTERSAGNADRSQPKETNGL